MAKRLLKISIAVALLLLIVVVAFRPASALDGKCFKQEGADVKYDGSCGDDSTTLKSKSDSFSMTFDARVAVKDPSSRLTVSIGSCNIGGNLYFAKDRDGVTEINKYEIVGTVLILPVTVSSNLELSGKEGRYSPSCSVDVSKPLRVGFALDPAVPSFRVTINNAQIYDEAKEGAGASKPTYTWVLVGFGVVALVAIIIGVVVLVCTRFNLCTRFKRRFTNKVSGGQPSRTPKTPARQSAQQPVVAQPTTPGQAELGEQQRKPKRVLKPKVGTETFESELKTLEAAAPEPRGPEAPNHQTPTRVGSHRRRRSSSRRHRRRRSSSQPLPDWQLKTARDMPFHTGPHDVQLTTATAEGRPTGSETIVEPSVSTTTEAPRETAATTRPTTTVDEAAGPSTTVDEEPSRLTHELLDAHIPDQRYALVKNLLMKPSYSRRYEIFFDDLAKPVHNDCTAIVRDLQRRPPSKQVRFLIESLDELARLAHDVDKYVEKNTKETVSDIPWSFHAWSDVAKLSRKQLENAFERQPLSYHQFLVLARYHKALTENLAEMKARKEPNIANFAKLVKALAMLRDWADKFHQSKDLVDIRAILSTTPSDDADAQA